MAKLPSFQFYPGDWQKDPDLRRCSHGARGVLMGMLCLMFECKPRGVLSTNNVPWTDDEIGIAVGGDYAAALGFVQELLAKDVLKRDPDTGAVYSARMVRDEHIRAVRSEAGKKGGNPKLKPEGSVCLSKTEANREQTGEQNPTPSSSSSSSPSGYSPQPPKGGEARKRRRQPKDKARQDLAASRRMTAADVLAAREPGGAPCA